MKRITTILTAGILLGLLAVLIAVPVAAKENAAVGFGHLYLDGETVRTNVPPSNVKPGSGRDAFYRIMDGAPEQLGVAAVGPGTGNYHGGQWAVHDVTWNTTPYLLTSEADVLDAADAGDVIITRVESADFRCPIQP
ncbi:MAG: hypothetical protein WD401_07425 [Thermomicrobiaceae bacterium]